MTDTKTLALVAEVERLTECLRYEQHRAGRRGTHGTDCYKWGSEHYECAMRQVERLTRELAEAKQDAERYHHACSGKGEYSVAVWDEDGGHDPCWISLAMKQKDIDVMIDADIAAMRRTDAGATSC